MVDVGPGARSLDSKGPHGRMICVPATTSSDGPSAARDRRSDSLSER
jgi:hypothetical protein